MKLKYRKKSSHSAKKRHLVWDFSILLVLTLGVTGFFIFSSNFGGLKLAKSNSRTPNATKQLSSETSLAEALKNQDKKNNLSSDPTKPSPETTNNGLLQKPQQSSTSAQAPANTSTQPAASTTPAVTSPPVTTPTDPCNYSLKASYTQQRDSAIAAENSSYSTEYNRLSDAFIALQQSNPDWRNSSEYQQILSQALSLMSNHPFNLRQIESTYQANVASAGCSL